LILKTSNTFKQEYNKINGKQEDNLINSSHESLMAEKCDYKQALGLTNKKLNYSSSSLLSWIMKYNPLLIKIPFIYSELSISTLRRLNPRSYI
jgi:arsenate reductase-like glutaredoxin family protein